MVRIRPKVTVPLLALCGIGCEDTNNPTRDGPPSVVWGSAGVTIADNDPPEPDSRLPWQVSVQPSLTIGSIDSEGADQLFGVTDAMRHPDGRIVIANSGSNELRVFNADGSHAGTWGGQGEGPGEFTVYSPTIVVSWPGDSVAAANPWGLRLSIFDSDGNHGRDISLGAGFPNFVGVLADAHIVANAPSAKATVVRTAGIARWDEEWAILAGDGTLRASLGMHPGFETHALFAPDGSIRGGTALPFSRGTMGSVWGELAVIGVSDRYEIRAYTADGSLARIVRRRGQLGSPTRGDIEAFYANLLPADMPDEQRENALNEVRDRPLVESFPAFSEILSDLAGNLWVQEYQMPREEAVVWTVFDAEGRIRGLIETPADLEVFEIGEDYVLGRVSDDLGVEYVQLWSLSRGEQ